MEIGKSSLKYVVQTELYEIDSKKHKSHAREQIDNRFFKSENK